MPIYEYQCVDCGALEGRVGGLDDDTSICAQCGGLMLRLDADVFKPYFDNEEILQDVIENDHQDILPAIRTGTRN